MTTKTELKGMIYTLRELVFELKEELAQVRNDVSNLNDEVEQLDHAVTNVLNENLVTKEFLQEFANQNTHMGYFLNNLGN